MKKGLIIALAAAFMLLAFAAGALAYVSLDVYVDTQAYTELTEIVETDFVLDFERSVFTPTDGDSSFNLEKHMFAVPTAGWPTPGGLTGTKFIDAYGGTTEFVECAVSGGYTGANGFISEYIYNVDEIHIEKSIVNKGEWNLLEEKWISGNGFTIIEKDLGTWGKDGGESHPTDALAQVTFQSPTMGSFDDYYNTGVGGKFFYPLPNFDTAMTWCQDRSMGDVIEYFESRIVTNEPFTYFESAEVDPYWPDIEPPERP